MKMAENTVSIVTISIDESFLKNHPTKKFWCAKLIRSLTISITKSTPIEYWVKDIDENHVSFTIKTYTNDDKSVPYKEVVKDKVKILLKYFKTMSTKLFAMQDLWLIRSLMILTKTPLDGTMKDLLRITVKSNDEVMLDKNIPFHVTGLEPVKYVVTKLCDGTTIRQFIDPYLQEHGVFCDYSKTLDEYNYMYNGLHVFEHYIANAWDGMSENNVITFNGCTYSNGIMYVYSVAKDIDTIKERFTKWFQTHVRSTDPAYVRQQYTFKRETARTISEGYGMRNLTRMARTDQWGFNDTGYPAEVFSWWCSQPANVLLLSNKEVQINVSALNSFFTKHHKDVPKPSFQSFSYFPREVFHQLALDNKHVFKKSTEKIVAKIFGDKPVKCIYGIDCRTLSYDHEPKDASDDASSLHPSKEDNGNVHTLIHMLLVFAKFKDDSFMQNFVQTHVWPLSVMGFDETTREDFLTTNDLVTNAE